MAIRNRPTQSAKARLRPKGRAKSQRRAPLRPSRPTRALGRQENLRSRGPRGAAKAPGGPRNRAPPHGVGRRASQQTVNRPSLGAAFFQSVWPGRPALRPAFICLGRLPFPWFARLGFLIRFFLFPSSCFVRPILGLPRLFFAFPRLFLGSPKNARPFGSLPDFAPPRARRFMPRGFLRCGQPRSAAAKRSPSPRPAL